MRLAQEAHQTREQRTDAAPEVVGEALPVARTEDGNSSVR